MQIGRNHEKKGTMMKYDQHSETFHYELDKADIANDDIKITPSHLAKIWDEVNELMNQLDQLDAMGTNLPTLTLTVIRLRALISTIPENHNMERENERK